MQDFAIILGAGSHQPCTDFADRIEDHTYRARMTVQQERVSDLMQAIRSALEIVVLAER